MSMIPLQARVAARASYLGLFVGLGLLGYLFGSWTLPVLAALVHGGFAEVHALTVVEFVFPGVPRFLSNELLKRHFPLPCMMLGLAGFAVFASAGARWWRRLVVARGWLTNAQAKAFMIATTGSDERYAIVIEPKRSSRLRFVGASTH